MIVSGLKALESIRNNSRCRPSGLLAQISIVNSVLHLLSDVHNDDTVLSCRAPHRSTSSAAVQIICFRFRDEVMKSHSGRLHGGGKAGCLHTIPLW